MGKQTGIGAQLFAGQYNLSGDVGAIDTIAWSRDLIDVTTIEDDARSRLPGVMDGTISFTGYFDGAAGHLHPVLGNLPSTDVILTAAVGTAIGDAAASLIAQTANYNETRGTDGSLALAVTGQASGGYGTEWGQLLTGRIVAAPGTASASANGGTATTTGAAAYLHVFGVSAGTVTVSVVDSADDVTFAAVPGLSFTATSAGTAQRVATSATETIDQYVRYVVAGGTATIAVNLSRNL